MDAGFSCSRCGNCCRRSGEVVLTSDDVERIGSFLGIGAERFADTMARLSSDRRQLVLDGDEDAPCMFLEFDGAVASCAIEPVKPEQCRNFPEKWNYPGWRKECRGI